MAEKNKNPMYQSIFQDLRNKIISGQYLADSFLPPERILSELYKVERPTLRKALSLLADQKYIKKMQGAGNKVIFSSTAHEANVEKEANTIVYAMPDSEGERGPQPYHMEICAHMEKLCAVQNKSLIFTKARAINESVPQWLYSNSVIGIIWVSDVNKFLLKSAHELNIPSVLCCNESSLFPRVNLDDIGGAYIATSHLISRNCKNICHITGVKDYHNAKRRLDGYKRAMLTHGFTIKPNNILYGDWSYESGYNLAFSALSKDPSIDGIFASNDMMALGALNAALQLKRSVPHDLKIIGIDNIEQTQTSVVPISTISFSQADVAAGLFLMLNAVFQRQPVPSEIEIPGNLIVRGST
ncbi:DNA-binding LacI/PurR family transcriptional regulator [Hydrogenoanaerobacterium saccharovorans]|uniref:DNA-binding transcriptional regulator, LacI/PurR family n=1 Tax=Hydrogenoanaerobacterium saccharovorans TaxID=474960 RepID=A0A1H7Z8G4_9FIRM|nr:GntR family transcriptional regulator [Hydrogenoanaerobacterium saccharovorans]RPF48773.1 DNA-binding LacI/PurR family transcriptional regulator [Hydrogenoanaerobacterium saccharovorans]SEM54531.1 DNA-binding transcriptional regulator, LacI/PurR family [Hydrogenoanaerobacterium saccharovorans]